MAFWIIPQNEAPNLNNLVVLVSKDSVAGEFLYSNFYRESQAGNGISEKFANLKL